MIVLKVVFNGQVNTIIWQTVELIAFALKIVIIVKNLKECTEWFLMVYFSIPYICYQEA